jgi:outer membrane protein OmpA-like peptidoglycan-associated protein
MKSNSKSGRVRAGTERRLRNVGYAGAMLALALAGCQSVPANHSLNADQIATLKQAGFHETDAGWELGLDDRLLFDTDQSTINPRARAAVVRLGQVLRKAEIEHVRVYGYTDSTGTDDYNQTLSKGRADAVSSVLVDAGIPPEGIVSEGEGKQHPVADNTTPEGRAQNRRVAIVVATP